MSYFCKKKMTRVDRRKAYEYCIVQKCPHLTTFTQPEIRMIVATHNLKKRRETNGKHERDSVVTNSTI